MEKAPIAGFDIASMIYPIGLRATRGARTPTPDNDRKPFKLVLDLQNSERGNAMGSIPPPASIRPLIGPTVRFEGIFR